MRSGLSLVVAGLMALACSNGSAYGTVGSGGGHHAQGASQSSSGSSGSSGSTTGGTGGTTGGTGSATGPSTTSSSGTTSGAAGQCDLSTALDACGDGGLVEVRWQVTDFCARGPFTAGASVTNFYDPSNATVTDPCGGFHLCVAPGTPVAFEVSAPSEATTETQTIVPTVSEHLPSSPSLYLYCTQALAQIGADLTDFNPTRPAIAVVIESLSGACSAAGWQVSLVLPDGGAAIAETGYFYGAIPMRGTVTGPSAGALIYNIDPTLQFGAVTAVLVGGGAGDGGLSDAGCAYVGGSPPFQFSGAIPIPSGNALGFYLYTMQ